MKKIRFTKHAEEKLLILSSFDFEIKKIDVIGAISKPLSKELRNNQILVLKLIDDKYALRVVYEIRNNEIVVITFYPVRRERYGI